MRQTLTNLTSPRLWLRGLGAAFIGGGASAFTTDQGISLAHKAGMDVQPLSIQAIVVCFLTAGALHAMQYLAQHPLPPDQQAQPTPDETSK